jgi:hypothetical protein
MGQMQKTFKKAENFIEGKLFFVFFLKGPTRSSKNGTNNVFNKIVKS